LDVLEETFWAVSTPGSPQYRNFMEIDQILDIVRPSPAETYSVYAWLHAHGINPSLVTDHGDAIEVRTTVGIASEIFGTTLHYFHHSVNGNSIIRQLGDFSVPEYLDDIIEFVSGLSEFPVPHLSVKPTPNPLTAVTIAPQSVWSLYKIPDSAKITGTSSVGVMEWEGQYFEPKQLTTFATDFAVQLNVPTADHIIGSNVPTSPQLEATLDIQWVLVTGKNAESWFWIEKMVFGCMVGLCTFLELLLFLILLRFPMVGMKKINVKLELDLSNVLN
jgi:tripeptidyl-peptidase-1